MVDGRRFGDTPGRGASFEYGFVPTGVTAGYSEG
jgi:hypothetical protein